MTCIYHNPRCSKSRQTLALLESHGIETDIILYLQQPPNAQGLLTICDMLAIEPQQLIRHKEKRFSELNLNIQDQKEALEWCQLMSDNPILIERPIVVHNEKARIGRPPENILELF